MRIILFSRVFSLSLVTAISLLTSSLLLSSDIVVSGNVVLTTNPSTATEGNILKGENRFIHNYGLNNTFVGENAGNFTMTGNGSNTGIGVLALTGNTTGEANTAVGVVALGSNTAGIRNTAVGWVALAASSTGHFNTAVGSRALNTATTSYNTAVGADALQATTTGVSNTAVGAFALSKNTTGQGNTGIGNTAIINCTTGSNNVGIGSSVLNNLTSGGQNIAIGTNSGINLTTGSRNIYISAEAATGTEANTIRIGGLSSIAPKSRCFIAGIRGIITGRADAVPVVIDSAGQLGTISSSAHIKRNIKDMADISSPLLQLRPVTFVYKSDETNTTQFGLIAEEVDEVFPLLVVYDQDGQPETLKYHVLPVLLLNEMKKQQFTIEQMGDIISDLLAEVQNLLIRVKTLENKA